MAHIVSCMLDLDQEDLSPTLNYIAKVAAEQEEAFCNESVRNDTVLTYMFP